MLWSGGAYKTTTLTRHHCYSQEGAGAALLSLHRRCLATRTVAQTKPRKTFPALNGRTSCQWLCEFRVLVVSCEGNQRILCGVGCGAVALWRCGCVGRCSRLYDRMNAGCTSAPTQVPSLSSTHYNQPPNLLVNALYSPVPGRPESTADTD